MIIQSSFGSAQTSLGYQFYDASGTLLGSRVTSGIVSGPETGSYLADATVPADAVGVFWDSATSEASEDLREALAIAAADQMILAAPYVPAETPVLVIPSPDPDESLSVLYIYTESISNVKSAGIEITVKLIVTPAKSERVLEIASKTMTTDADGYASLTVQRDHRYRVTCPELALNVVAAPAGETLDLLTLIP